MECIIVLRPVGLILLINKTTFKGLIGGERQGEFTEADVPGAVPASGTGFLERGASGHNSL